MKRKLILWQIAYYVLTLLVYVGFFYGASLLLDLSGKADNLGSVMAVTYFVLFFMTPVLVVVLMRFSLFKWYVDPIAAAEIPLFLYVSMIASQIRRSSELRSAFLLVNNKLGDDGGMGWLFLIGLFVFGFVASLSFARKNEKSISFRVLARFIKDKKDPSTVADTDWKYDFSSLPKWDRRDTIPYVFDKLYPIPQSDTLCCIYSIAEVKMGWYVGLLAILKNKADPELLLNVTEGIDFINNFSVSKNGNLVFLQGAVYKDKVYCPILIIDIANRKFAYYNTENYNPCYKIVELSEYEFGIDIDETQRSDEKLNALANLKIDLRSLDWFDLSELNMISEKIM